MSDSGKLLFQLSVAGGFVAGMIAVPPLAPFFLTASAPVLTNLLLGTLGDETIKKAGDALVEVIGGVAGDAVKEQLKGRFSGLFEGENMHLERALAESYKRTLKEIEASLDEQPVVTGILWYLPWSTVSAKEKRLIELFPDANETREIILKKIDGLSGDQEDLKKEITLNVKGSLSLWWRLYQERKSRRLHRRAWVFLISMAGHKEGELLGYPEGNLAANVTGSLSKKLHEIINTDKYKNAWIDYQRLYLESIYSEIRDNNKNLSAKNQEALRPIEQKLQQMITNDQMIKALAEETKNILQNLDALKADFIEHVDKSVGTLVSLSNEILEKVDEANEKLDRVLNQNAVLIAQNAQLAEDVAALRVQQAEILKQFKNKDKKVDDAELIRLNNQSSEVREQLIIASEAESLTRGEQKKIKAEIQNVAQQSQLVGRQFTEYKFVGREGELNTLKALIEKGVATFLIYGAPGLGKTALARKLALEIREKFGALIEVDMRGTSKRILSPTEAMLQILAGLEIEVKAGLSESEIFKAFTKAAGKYKPVIILDNAKDAKQISPLNIFSHGIMIITSRTGDKFNEIEKLKLSKMSPADAYALLYYFADKEQYRGKENLIAEAASHIPLALISAANTWLSDNKIAEPSATTEAVFSSAYTSLTDELQHRLLELSILRGEFSEKAAQAVIGADQETTGRILESLVRSALVEWNALSANYVLHEEVRSFADQQWNRAPKAADEKKALHARAADFFALEETDVTSRKAISDIQPQLEELHHRLEAEQYDRAAHLLNDASDDDTGIRNFLDRWGYNELLRELHEELIGKISDKKLEGRNLSNLGMAYFSLGSLEKAFEHTNLALKLSRETGDRELEAKCLGDLGIIYIDSGDYSEAIRCHQQSLDYYSAAAEATPSKGNRRGMERALGNLGSAYGGIGEYEKAIDFLSRSYEISKEISQEHAGDDQCNLGDVYLRIGEYDAAIKCFEQALKIVRKLNDRENESNCLGGMGIAYQNKKKTSDAKKLFQQAYQISRDIKYKVGEGQQLYNLGTILFENGNWRLARDDHYLKAVELNVHPSNYLSLIMLGMIYLREGKTEPARRSFQAGYDKCQEIIDKSNALHPKYSKALALLGLGENEKALAIYREIFDGSTGRGDLERNIKNLQLLANSSPGIDGLGEAVKMFEDKLNSGENINEGGPETEDGGTGP